MDTKVTIDLSQFTPAFVNDLRLAAGREFRRMCERANASVFVSTNEREQRKAILRVMDTAEAIDSK